MAFPDRRTANVLLTILLFAVVLAIVYIARGVIVIFVFAILFAYLIDPIVRFLQRHSFFFKNLRGPHVLKVYLSGRFHRSSRGISTNSKRSGKVSWRQSPICVSLG
jgi:hypothetical protein